MLKLQRILIKFYLQIRFFSGVGAFKKVMEKLEKNKLTETLIKTREIKKYHFLVSV